MNLIKGDEAFDAHRIKTLILLERIGGSISLMAVFLIFVAYALTPQARNVQNTFIVFASVANVGASVASIIAMSGLERGVNSSLCQAQSFMFQMFMQSDPWWSLAMAVNVFLVFFFRARPDSFRKWWWLYCLICYGGPFVIALALLLVRRPHRGLVYGQATIWCWVDGSWENIRIYTYYMLIWICIVGSLLLYFLVGYHVFRARNRVKSFTASASRDATTNDQTQTRPRVDLLSVPQDCFYGTIVTEVQVVHSTASTTGLPALPKKAHLDPAAPHVSFDENLPPVHSAPSQYFSTATSAASTHGLRASPARRLASSTNAVLSKFVVEDPIKRAYLRTSFLFALSVLVTWIPSSLNRIHSWLTGHSPYEFQVATAAVLPLQGLWNAVIFFITSHRALRHRLRGDVPLSDTNPEETEIRSSRPAAGQNFGEESILEDTDSGSELELRRMAEMPSKRSRSF